MLVLVGAQTKLARVGLVLGLMGLGCLFLLGLGWAARPVQAALLVPQVGETCFATLDSGTFVYSGTTAQAVRDAVNAVSVGGVVKLAGYCPGVQAQGGSTQVALITKTLTLMGGYTVTNWATYDPAANATVLDAQNGGRVISASTALTLTGLTLQRGLTPVGQRGGGLAAAGNVTLWQLVFFSNTAFLGDGGGAWVGGQATVSNTLFVSNTAGGSYGGGAWFQGGGQVFNTTFLSNTITGNGGGAYFNAPAFVTQTLFMSNTVLGGGGGVFFFNTAILSNVQFISNTAGNAGGGLYALGLTNGYSLAVLGNRTQNGGGAFLLGTNPITLTQTVFQNNIATNQGGAVMAANAAPKRLINGLFVGNQAVSGTVLALNGAVGVLVHSTLVGGSAPTQTAIYVQGGVLDITNTLLVSHAVGLELASGTLRENYNLFAAVTTPYIGAVTVGGRSLTGTAGFYNTSAYTLTAASNALEAGAPAGVTSDYFGRPRPQGRVPDIGYYESDAVFPITFTLAAQPAHLFANGLDEAVLTVTALMTNGLPWAGQPITLVAPLGTLANSVRLLNANGVATTTYTVGVIPGTTPLTATLSDLGIPKTATATVTLKPNPLIGTLAAQFGGQTITYTLVVTNVDVLTQTVNLSGSVPTGASPIGVTGGVSVTTGGDYGFGYAATSGINLAPNQSYTLQWTIQFVGFTGDVVTQGHAESTTARLRLPAALQIFRILFMPVYK